MTHTKVKNRLNLLINKIAVDAENMELVNEIVIKLAAKCEVDEKSVRRWMFNGSQPTSTNLTRIVLFLNAYDASITYSDFFEKSVPNGTSGSVSPKLNLVK